MPSDNHEDREKKGIIDFARYLAPKVCFCLALVACIVWLVTLVIHFPEISVESLSLSNFHVNSSSHTVNGDWNLTLKIYNPTMKSILYDDVSSSILYESEVLGTTGIPWLKKQGKYKHTLVETSFSAVNSSVHNLVDVINQDVARGSVAFDVKVQGIVVMASVKRQEFRVCCKHIKVVGFTSTSAPGSGKMVGESSKCFEDD